MASAPANQQLPVFYKELIPLNSQQHASWKSKPLEDSKFLVNQHAVPVTVEEFPLAQRNFPIIFSAAEKPVPLALMGMNEGVNVFVDEEGKFTQQIYIPAYIRRYPFMLARLRPDAQDMSLCFDPQAGNIGEFDEGQAFFDGTEATEHTKNILGFCENYEQAMQRTSVFVDELLKSDLLMDGELKIENETFEKPFLYRGFKMVNEEKLRDMRGDELRKWNQNGMLPLIYAHLFSLSVMRDIFSEQARQGKMPQLAPTNS